MCDIIIATNKTVHSIADMIDEIQKTALTCKIIATCQPLSAAQNRNYGLECADSDIIVMLDDDISGFYDGWVDDLLIPFVDANVILVSARLLNQNGSNQNAMGMENQSKDDIQYIHGKKYNGIEYKRVATAAIAFRKTGLRFNEGFLKSGHEDTCFMNRICEKYINCEFAISNKCRLIHANAMQGQGDLEAFRNNKKLYCSLYPWDEVAKVQKAWHPSIRGQE